MEKRRQSLGRSRRQSFGGFSELEQGEPAKRRRSISLDDESEIDPLNADHLGLESWSLDQRPRRSQSFSHPPEPGDPLSERRLARARVFSHRRDTEDGDRKQRNRRTHSFSHQPLEEENDLEHQLCEERKEKEEYREKYEQAREENLLLKKKIGKCSTCSMDPFLSAILSKIGAAAAAGYIDPADGRDVFELSSVGTKEGGIPSKKPKENSEAAAALIPDDGGDDVFEPSFETEEEGIPAKNLEKATEVGEPVPNVITEVFQTSSPPGNQESDITTIKLSKGRLIDLVKKKSVSLERVTYLVIDEADRMFDMGFEPQVRSIADHVRPDRQTMLFSATFRKKVERLAWDILNDPVRVIQGDLGEANQDVTQVIEVLPTPAEKWTWLLQRLVGFSSEGSVLIFVTKKVNAEELSGNLKQNDFQG